MSITAADTTIDPTAPVPEAAAVPARRPDNAWIWQVTALSVVLGGMLALAVRTTEQSRKSTLPGGNRLSLLNAIVDREKDQVNQVQQELAALRRSKDKIIKEVNSDSAESNKLRQEFDAVKDLAGLTAKTGPGLNIVVRDSPDTPPPEIPFEEYIVHDQDLNHIISDLKAAGAQHLAISGADSSRLQRVIVSTTARCVGPTAVVNGTYLSSPYHIVAIGDVKALRTALERPDGYIRARELDTKKMIEISEVESLKLPEYAGRLQARYAKPVPAPTNAPAAVATEVSSNEQP